MKKRRFLSCLLTAGVIITSTNVTVPVLADTATTDTAAVAVSTASNELSSEKVSKILESVKQKIFIPKEYTSFQYDYMAKSSYNDDMWSFNWQKENGNGEINIKSDKAGNILSYMVYDYEKKNVPTYLKSELQDTAYKFIQKAAADISDKLEFTSSSYSGIYRNNYYYVYTRMENGILMPQQQIMVGVNATTGQVESFDTSSWNYEVSIPAKNIQVTKEKAIETLRKQITMNLKYETSYTYDKSGITAEKAYLVYEPSVNYLSVDAVSGKLYTSLDEWNLSNGSESFEKESSASDMVAGGSNDEGGLTAKEISTIAEMEELLTKQEAIDLIKKNKSLYIESASTIITASLMEDSSRGASKEKQYYWNIQFSEPNTDKEAYYFNSYSRAVIDAKTGEIVSFRANVKDYQYYINTGEAIPSVKYTKVQSQTLFEDFAKAQNEERFLSSKLSNNNTQYVVNYKNGKKVYGGYSLNYNRVYDGIDYADNYIYGSVDAITGRITSYGYYWNESVVFESAKQIISAKEAFDSYIQYDGFDLVYELNTIHTETAMTKEARLVYQVNISPCYVSALTGRQLDYSGSEYKKSDTDYQYGDISGHSYERSIRLLSDLGAGFKETKFNPDNAITKSELQQLAEAVTYVNREYELKGSSKVTREDAANYAVELLGLKKLAGISGIYQTGAVDAEKISDSKLGSVAIAKGLGILTLNDKNEFRPTENLTRAEAADMLIKLIGTDMK